MKIYSCNITISPSLYQRHRSPQNFVVFFEDIIFLIFAYQEMLLNYLTYPSLVFIFAGFQIAIRNSFSSFHESLFSKN